MSTYTQSVLINNAGNPLGIHLTRILARRGYLVLSVDNKANIHHIEYLHLQNPEVEELIHPIVKGSDTVTGTLKKLSLEKIDLVINLQSSAQDLKDLATTNLKYYIDKNTSILVASTTQNAKSLDLSQLRTKLTTRVEIVHVPDTILFDHTSHLVSKFLDVINRLPFKTSKVKSPSDLASLFVYYLLPSFPLHVFSNVHKFLASQKRVKTY
ncbi:unnamed protein product [Ambrosiozyma monospora]|uniref:Unnamed protein product n=1 Tax=Ambrosiozyma monospora TaxID=43982 RepID=A0A9W6YUL4_AMBMO|nr:unnamed protein product [Ambrosiozyma monospora]